MKQIFFCLLILFLSFWQAAGQNEEGFLRDSLTPAVKYANQPEERLSGSYHTDMQTLLSKAWSPVGENDPVKFALTLPGVSSGADGFSAFFARGGNLGNNLITLDGVRIYGYSHLLGLTTALPSEALSAIDFNVSGFSGDQGDLTASHIRLVSTENDYSRFKSSASVSNSFLGASVSAPVVKDRVSVFAAGRYSPFGLEYRALQAVASNNYHLPDLSPRVGDIYIKTGVKISPRHNAFVSLFGSDDTYGIGFKGSSYDLGWRNFIGHTGYRYTGTITEVRADVSFNYYQNWQSQRSTTGLSENALHLQSMIREWNYSVDARHTFARGLFAVSEGIKVQRGHSAVGTEKRTGHEADSPLSESLSRPVTTSLWLELSFNWKNRIELMGNIRRNWYNNHAERPMNQYQGTFNEWSARATFTLCRYLGLEATYDHRTQFHHTLEGTPLGWSVDLIVPPTYAAPPEQAQQYYAGIFSSLGRSSLTIGAYYKEMQNLAYYVDAMALFSAAASSWFSNVRMGSGTSYGAELHYELHTSRLDGAVSYTWSKTDRMFQWVNLDRPFPAKFDRRHILNTHASVTLAQGNKTEHCLTVSACLQSGHYESVSGGSYVMIQPDGEAFPLNFYDQPNNYQMPLYFRMDTGYQIRLNRKYKSSLTLGIYNVLNRHNPSLLTYDSDSKAWYFVSFFPIMPNLKYLIAF